MDADEFTPRELGLILGSRWATLYPTRTFYEAERLAASGEVSDELRTGVMDGGMEERLAEFDDDSAEAEFWQGFIHGVRAEVSLNRIAGRD